MKRTILLFSSILLLSACQTSPERAPLAPLPDAVTPRQYSLLLDRARLLATQANEAGYIDDFARVQIAAEGLQQTARYFPSALEVPARVEKTLTSMAGDLGKLAKELNDAAGARDAKKTNEILARINLRVREMRIGDPAPPVVMPGTKS